MSKKIDEIQKMVDELEADVNKQLKVSQQELDKAYEKTEQQFTEFEKQQDRLFKMFENPEMSHQADLELEKMAKEMGIDLNAKNSDNLEIDRIIKEAEREVEAERKIGGKGSKMTQDQLLDLEIEKLAKEMGIDINEKDSVINTAKQSGHQSSISEDNVEKEYQQLLKEVEQEESNKQSARKSPSSGLSIEERVKHRGANISTMIKSHGAIADEFAKTSSNPEEKAQLTTFSENATKLSKIVDKVTSIETPDKNVQDLSGDQAKEKQQSSNKLMSGIAQAAEKLYSGLKSGISTAIDKIKELGSKCVDSIKSWFSKPQKEQEVVVAQTISATKKTVDTVKNPSEKLKEATKDLQSSFKDLQKQYAKILPKEKQAAFKKWQENKVADKMTSQELIKETKKIMGALVKQHVKNTEQDKQKLQQAHKNRLNKINNKGAPSSGGRS
ncbi:hypothetical protein Trichorick_01197 [Candidatus Trichorickettsia mobilis]|uniref:Coiled coil protein n=1 Tax=Candidatus Trichorickettsia mobilis TaxID=1346319 RepID=A0ABZ0UW10_9RICK|nr:hypothetical protein [Candidatus Trichorickettsia mobilis]WPY01287.1 hypothetical protein Trichorick_01197 [Candidatus Trichorickettsia mobilis]